MKNAITTTAHKKNKRKSNICTRHKEIARSHAKNNDNHLQSQQCVCVCAHVFELVGATMHIAKSCIKDVLSMRKIISLNLRSLGVQQIALLFHYELLSFTDIYFTVHLTVLIFELQANNRCICLLQRKNQTNNT